MTLAKYKQKRKFGNTPEPKPEKKSTAKDKLIFVVHRHLASRLHYDLRLEMDGVLKSWAVPKGPSMSPADKRLAVMVEDHPLDYAEFSGVIPEGNYGAGIVEIWDKGTMEPVEKMGKNEDEQILLKQLKSGSLKFVLQGKKLKGEFALVKMKQDDHSWLLIKHRDKFAVEKYNSEEQTAKNSPISKALNKKKLK